MLDIFIFELVNHSLFLRAGQAISRINDMLKYMNFGKNHTGVKLGHMMVLSMLYTMVPRL